jgi:hypothetical integral membrane protein (TIGR02206 family)
MPADSFHPLGPAHVGILAAVPVLAAALASAAREDPTRAVWVRFGLASALFGDSLAWYAVTFARGEVRPPHGLPLDLCDLMAWVTVYALVAGRAWALEGAYFLGLAGSGMALLTPDIGARFPSWEAAQFFVAHGLVVGAVLFLVWTGALRPRPRAWWGAFLSLNAYAALVAVFDACFGTNYMYLRDKPQAETLLDLLGPWPVYILAAEPVALILLRVLALPFQSGPRMNSGPRIARA